MRKLTLTSAALVTLAGAASADNIHCGSQKGSYTTKICPAIIDVIGTEPSKATLNVIGGQALWMEHLPTVSKGTIDNRNKVREGAPLDLGVGQWDQLAKDSEGLFVVHTGVSECLYVVTKDDSLVTASNLSPRMPFGLPSEASGSTATFMDLEPFASMRRVTNYDNASAAISAVKNNDVVAAGFVQIPDTTNAVFEEAGDLNFIGVINRRMLRDEVSGIKLYEGTPGVQVRTGSFWGAVGVSDNTGQSITTSCTPVVVFGKHPDTLEGYDKTDMLDIVSALEKASQAGLLIPDTGDWRKMFASMAEARENALEGALDKLEELGGNIN